MFIVPFLTAPFLFLMTVPFLSFGSAHSLEGSLSPTAAQFSGAIQWAHKKGIEGEGESIIIIEYPYNILQQVPDHVRERIHVLSSSIEAPPSFIGDHALQVASVLNQIVPHSHFLFLSPADLPHLLSIEDYFSTSNGLHFKSQTADSDVINYSFNVLLSSDIPIISSNRSSAAFLKNYRRLVREAASSLKNLATFGSRKMIVMAAGNNNLDISNPFPRLSEKEKVYDVAFTLATDLTIQDSVIIVGALSPAADLSLFSNYPGHNRAVQERFLCTLGEMGVQGTSFSAPIISGAALLIKDEYPILTMQEIQQTLLESASKNFFINKGNHSGKFVYDPKDGPPDLSAFKDGDPDNILTEEFNPVFYGKGRLDLRAAFIYADLLRKNRYRKGFQQQLLSKQQLLTQMKRILKAQDVKAATKIQAVARGYLARKKLKSPPPYPPPSYASVFPPKTDEE